MAHARRQRFWERAAPVLRVVGAILLAAGMIHLYAELVIFDARTFGARAALSLGDPRVAGYVAERIADETIAQRRDLMAYRPLLVGTARAIVELRALPGGLPPRRPGRPRRPLLPERGAPRPLGPRPRRARPQRARPRPRARRPHPREPARGRRWCSRAAGARRPSWRSRGSATGSAATPSWRSARAGCSSSWASPCRATAARRSCDGGAALATAALVLFFLPPLARTALTALGARARSCGRWWPGSGTPSRAGSGSGRSSSRAWASSSPRPRRRSRATWRSSRSRRASGDRLRKPARTWQGEIAPGHPPHGVGLFAALRPAATLYGLTVIAGALLAFEGLRELFMLVPPAPAGGRASTPRRPSPRPARRRSDWEGARTWLALRARRPPGARPDRRRGLLHAQPRRAARDARLHGRLQRRPRAVRPPARRGRLPRRPQLDVGRRVRRLDVPEPGAGLRLGPRPRHPGAALRRALRNAHRRPGEDRPPGRGRVQRQVREGRSARRPSTRRCASATASPGRPPARAPPTSATASASSAPFRSRRCWRACGTSSSRTRARSSSS